MISSHSSEWLFLWKMMKQNILGIIGFLFLKILSLTYRYNLIFKNAKDEKIFFELLKSKKPNIDKNFILGFFHQDEFCLIPYFQNSSTGTLVSVSKDGKIMSIVAKLFRYQVVRGSSSKKAISGLIAAIKKTKQGYNFSFAVDGPRGPIYKVKPGIISVQDKCQRPIIPIKCEASHQKLFDKAWNKSRLPLMFSKITLKVGEIKMYESHLDLENELLSLNDFKISDK